MESYIEDKKKLYSSIIIFLEESDEQNDDEFITKFQQLNNLIRSQNIEGNIEEMRQFLEIIKSIGEHHHRDQQFNKRLNQLLEHYKDQIKRALTNLEIFHIFENNKKIVLFLLQNGIITISDKIYKEMINKIENNGNHYWHFFIPELENFVGEEKFKFVKNQLLKQNPSFFSDYEKKRQEGENDSYICSLIRQDSVEEFISHVNCCKISLSSQILPSIFETNSFLIDNTNTTLIEYSVFFGSIQIFRYLLMSNVNLESSLWIYGIHSKNAKLIHLLESNQVPPPKSYIQCLIESIVCHHNDIADYIENNLLDQEEKNSQQDVEIISNYIKSHNYWCFTNSQIIRHGFFYLSIYHYNKLVELLLKKKEKSIENKLIQYSSIRTAVEKNESDVIYQILLKTTKIIKGPFNGTKLKHIIIPSSVTSIENYAFSGCSSLTQIAIPSSVTSIGNNVFSGCSSLTQIIIPSSVTSIGNGAFSECSSLTQITIPSVTSIGNDAFNGCSSLTQFFIHSCNDQRIRYYENRFLIYKSHPRSEVYDTLLWCNPTSKIVTVPSFIKTISSTSFTGCSLLTQITILSSVTSIGDNAFRECSSLTQITILSSLTSIGDNTFRGCSSLKQITIPSSVTSIGNYAFKGCSSLTQTTILSSVTSIGDNAFEGCSSLTQITMPSSATSIGTYVFYDCSSLTQITIPSSATSIGTCAFYRCSSLTQITFEIPSSVTSIGDYAFYFCSSLTQITIPSSVTSIEDNAFRACSSLEEITFEIPSSVTSIGDNAFCGCSSLTQITIPSSVTSIREDAFCRCSSLTQITIPSSVTSIGNYAFYGCLSLAQITFEIPSSVTSIGKCAFRECSSLTQITIPSSVTSIRYAAFYECSSLTQITFEIPTFVTEIGDYAFSGCSSLTQITIPSSVTSIGNYAFYGCKCIIHFETILKTIASIKANF